MSFLPATLGGLLAAVVAVLTIVAIVAGGLIKLGNIHIDARIRATMKPINDHLEAIRLQLVSTDGEISRRVGELEKTIENGLTHRTTRIEDKMDRLLEHYQGWNGDERRGH